MLLSGAAEKRAEKTPVLENCARAIFATIQANYARAPAVAAFNPVNLISETTPCYGSEDLVLIETFSSDLGNSK